MTHPQPPSLPNTDACIVQWLEWLKQNQAADYTLSAYKSDLHHLTALYPLPTPDRYQSTHLHYALGRLHADGIQPRSLARMLSAWRNFFNWLAEQYQLQYNPCLGVQAPYGHYPDPKILSLEAINQLLDIAPDPAQATAVELRDQAIFELLYSSGLRLAEIIALDIEPVQTEHYQSQAWLHLAEHEVHIHSKHHRQREVPIGSKAIQALEHWLPRRHELLRLPADPGPEHTASAAALFLGLRGLRISPRVIQKQLQQRAQKVGIQQAVYPHRLRNSFANHLLESSNDLMGVQQLLGHAASSSTAGLKQLNPEQLAQFLQAHPRHNKKN